MAHFYVVRTKSDKTGPVEKKLFYGVPVTTGRVTTEELAQEITGRCTLTRGDVMAAVCALSEIILERLKDGYSVELKEVGDLYLSAGSQGYKEAKDCTPHRVKAKRVCFRMSPRLRKEMQFFKFERYPFE